MQEQKRETNKKDGAGNKEILQIVSKISSAENVLIALSQNPTADELAAAIGLSLFINKNGKHATAIYSGKTPNILEFLNPEASFEKTTDSLQDFIIAISKEKADHLRYKEEGDFVKLYITPYRTRISEEDLEFSYGDFNVGLVVALNVPNSNSLDQALMSHGRILHDAETINISASAPKDFGNIQWSDSAASSVSEMVAQLLFEMESEMGTEVDGDVATALLTGVFVATERFSNNRTQPETMNLAARLMSLGANQQLISEYLKKAETGGAQEANDVPQDDRSGQEMNDTDEKRVELQAQNVSAQNGEGKIEINQTGVNENLPKAGGNVVAPVAPSVPNDKPLMGDAQDFSGASQTQNELGAVYLDDSSSSEGKNDASDNKHSLLQPISNGGEMRGVGGSSGAVNLQPIGTGLPEVNLEGINQPSPETKRPELGQMATPFEETPAPGYVNDRSPMVGAPAPEAVARPGGSEFSLSSLGAKSSTDESVMNELKNLPNEPLGKDYGEEVTGENSGYVGGNPALVAAPGVNEGPEENHIPGLDFSRPVSFADDEGKPVGNDNSFVIGQGVLSDSGSTNSESKINETSSFGGTLEPKPQGMPLPGEEILPPPPTPPVDFDSIKTEQTSSQVQVPISQTPGIPSVQVGTFQSANSQSVETESSTPSLPQVDQNVVSDSNFEAKDEKIEAPTAFSNSQSSAPLGNDPGAFRIPGM